MYFTSILNKISGGDLFTAAISRRRFAGGYMSGGDFPAAAGIPLVPLMSGAQVSRTQVSVRKCPRALFINLVIYF